jgi:release factor glutamine methyltransferase
VTEIAFAGLPILTAPGRVMTPRDASEQLVAAACAWVGSGPARICDVGTGSGAIAIAIARECPEAVVWATDTSRCAVALARANVRRHGLEGRVIVEHGDLLDPVPGELDVIVANLPYLPLELALRRPELAAEPPEAVFAAGDGLGPYRRLLGAAPERLAPDGRLLFQFHRRVHSFARPAVAAA